MQEAAQAAHCPSCAQPAQRRYTVSGGSPPTGALRGADKEDRARVDRARSGEPVITGPRPGAGSLGPEATTTDVVIDQPRDPPRSRVRAPSLTPRRQALVSSLTRAFLRSGAVGGGNRDSLRAPTGGLSPDSCSSRVSLGSTGRERSRRPGR